MRHVCKIVFPGGISRNGCSIGFHLLGNFPPCKSQIQLNNLIGIVESNPKERSYENIISQYASSDQLLQLFQSLSLGGDLWRVRVNVTSSSAVKYRPEIDSLSIQVYQEVKGI